MSDIGSMVAQLVAAGCAPEVAARVVAEAFTAGVATYIPRNSTGIPPDSVAEKRRAYDRERKRKSTGIPPDSTGIPPEAPNAPLSSLSEDKKDNRKRGARLPEDWSPSESDRLFASELGWSESQIDSESANYRDYWIAKPGSGGCKLDWPATWRKWVRSSKIKPVGTVATVRNDAPVDWDSICTTYKKFGIWSKHAPGNSPDSSSCRCPPEILTKHGISTETMQ